MKAIYLDMDGTFVNLYADKDWLPKLRALDESVYANAKPKCNMSSMARALNRLKREGYTIGIISWLSKEPEPAFDKRVEQAKLKWLKKHLKSVHFDEVHIIPYGTPKSTVAHIKGGLLIDDEAPNRREWVAQGGCACDAPFLLNALAILTA